MINFTAQIYVTDKDGEEHEIDCRISYDASYQAERISGPPEDCYPAEGAMDLTSVEPIAALPEGITQEMITVAAMADDERLTELAWADYFERGNDAAADRADYEYDKKREREYDREEKK